MLIPINKKTRMSRSGTMFQLQELTKQGWKTVLTKSIDPGEKWPEFRDGMLSQAGYKK